MHCGRKAGVLVVLFAFCAVAAAGAELTSGSLATDTPWQTPYYTVDSAVEGPTLLIIGGIHGNEPAGYRAAEQIRHWPIVQGKLVVVPAANRLGLKANTRFLPGEPDERRDLNRNFPGEDWRAEPAARSPSTSGNSCNGNKPTGFSICTKGMSSTSRTNLPRERASRSDRA